MTTLCEAAQQALEQLKINRTNFRKGPSKSICKMLAGGNDEAIEALEAALAEPAQESEPVAWMVYTKDGKSVCVTDNPADFTDQHRALPLYTAPLQRKPLTEEMTRQMKARCETMEMRGAFADGWLSAEAAHGIGKS